MTLREAIYQAAIGQMLHERGLQFSTTSEPLTILERARVLARLADLLHAECIELTLPSGSLNALAQVTAKHANQILNSLECCRESEASDALLGEGRR